MRADRTDKNAADVQPTCSRSQVDRLAVTGTIASGHTRRRVFRKEGIGERPYVDRFEAWRSDSMSCLVRAAKMLAC